MPTQVFVSVTPAVTEFLKTCRAAGASKLKGQDAVDMDELYRLADEHARLGGAPVQIHELMEGAEVVSRRPADGPALTDLERLRLEAQERSYQRMVQGVAPLAGAQRRKDDAAHHKGFQWATNFGLQVIVAFIGAFLLGYYFVETFVAPDNGVAKAVAGAACSFATLLLETCLLVIHDSKEQMISKKAEQRAEKDKQRARQRASKEAAATTVAAPASAVPIVAAASEAPAEGAQAEPELQGADAAPKPEREKKTD
mmetsp:Transcript_52202/g.151981  ORF Transcript_52202/g.151981 Transcript_52202/m.151981 type:complete len:255 (+) Transcript_52202:133-897(+)